MNLTCLFFGHDPSHQFDFGRESGWKDGVVFFWVPDAKAICSRCNSILKEKYYSDKLPEVRQAGVV